MPFFDRYWWLRVVLSMLGLVIVLPFLLVMLSIFPIRTSSRGFDEIFWLETIVEFFLLLLLVLVLFGVVSDIGLARRRAITRWESLAGRADQIPLSTIHADASLVPDLTQGPLILSWRPAYAQRMPLAFLLVFCLVIGSGALYGAYLFLTTPVLAGGPSIAGLSLSVVMAGFLVAFAVGSLTFSVIVLGEALDQPTGAIFTDEGAQERTAWRRRRMVRWEDARLLEVGLENNQYRQYILYGANGAFARWMDYLPTGAIGATSLVRTSWYMPDSGSNEDMSRRLREALALVAARVGLAPRTFVGGLKEKTTTTEPRRSIGGLLFIVVFLLILLSVGAFILGLLAIPLLAGLYLIIQQPLPFLSLLSGGTLALGGALILVWIPVDILWRLLPSRAASDGEPATLPDELFPASTRAYSLVIRQTLRDAILSFIIPLLLTIGGVLVLSGLLLQPPTSAQHGLDHYAVVGAVISGIFGAIILIFRFGYGLRSVTIIQATAQGLRAQHPRHTLDLPWEAVETLKLSKASDRPRVYSVSGDTGKIAIAWRANMARVNNLDGAVPLSAIELAALIERRTGITLSEESG